MKVRYTIRKSAYSRGTDWIAETMPGYQFIANHGHILQEGSKADLKPRLAMGVRECDENCECRQCEF